MVSQEELMRKVMDNVSTTLVENLRTVIAETAEREITKSLTSALVESEFHKRLSRDMRKGLQKIYKEIAQAAQTSHAPAEAPALTPSQADADRLFSEASQQLGEILATTEQATVDIMDIVERHFELQPEAAVILDNLKAGTATPDDIERLSAMHGQLGDDLVTIMTTLSFQDLTGQRIKKIVAALQAIESTVVELFLSSGLLMKAHAETPDRDLDELEAETRKAVSELKGPTRDASQANIDDMLAQLGL